MATELCNIHIVGHDTGDPLQLQAILRRDGQIITVTSYTFHGIKSQCLGWDCTEAKVDRLLSDLRTILNHVCVADPDVIPF